jgi:hypothetical protein
MGALLATGQLTTKDLQWAAARHYNVRVKAAARTLLAAGGNTAAAGPVTAPAPSRAEVVGQYGPDVRKGSQYLEDQEFDSIAYVFFALGGGLASVLWWLFAVLTTRGDARFLPGFMEYLGLSLAIVGFAYWRYYRRARSYRQGRHGEERAIEELRKALDHRWTIFRNLHLPDRQDDLDVVLVGPGGVWVVEVKAFGGTVRVRDGVWERQVRGGWTRLRSNPAGQVQANAFRLREFLQREGIDVRWVSPAIALGKGQPVAHFVGANPPVWQVSTLKTDVAAVTAGARLAEPEIQRIVAVLTREADRQLGREEAR